MDYAQSRLQARFADLADESFWRELAAQPQAVTAAQMAQARGASRWATAVAPDADIHATELALRAHWRVCVAEVATWVPDHWRPALLWTRELADLPALCHLARGAAPLPWMLRDPVLQAYARTDSITREALLREHFKSFMGPSSQAFDHAAWQTMPGPSEFRLAWLQEWRRRWPKWSETASLEVLAQLFDTALKEPAPAGRRELVQQLHRLFRRSVLQPVEAFIYLALAALAMERLRSAALQHALAHHGIVAP